jgi:hypothetical protein
VHDVLIGQQVAVGSHEHARAAARRHDAASARLADVHADHRGADALDHIDHAARVRVELAVSDPLGIA